MDERIEQSAAADRSLVRIQTGSQKKASQKCGAFLLSDFF
jgi:hypothetical protein